MWAYTRTMERFIQAKLELRMERSKPPRLYPFVKQRKCLQPGRVKNYVCTRTCLFKTRNELINFLASRSSEPIVISNLFILMKDKGLLECLFQKSRNKPWYFYTRLWCPYQIPVEFSPYDRFKRSPICLGGTRKKLKR